MGYAPNTATREAVGVTSSVDGLAWDVVVSLMEFLPTRSRSGQQLETMDTAYLDNDTSRNVIHSPEEAKRLGYEGGLVTGVVVFGWAVPAVISGFR